jgi:hypothetical protein
MKKRSGSNAASLFLYRREGSSERQLGFQLRQV